MLGSPAKLQLYITIIWAVLWLAEVVNQKAAQNNYYIEPQVLYLLNSDTCA